MPNLADNNKLPDLHSTGKSEVSKIWRRRNPAEKTHVACTQHPAEMLSNLADNNTLPDLHSTGKKPESVELNKLKTQQTVRKKLGPRNLRKRSQSTEMVENPDIA